MPCWTTPRRAPPPPPVIQPTGDPATDDLNERALLRSESAARSYLLSVVTDPKDLDLPVLAFLEKYPAMKSQMAEAMDMPSLAFDQYAFSPSEVNLLYAT